MEDTAISDTAISDTAISDTERLFFETHGYLMVEDALDPGEVERLREVCDRAEARFLADESLPGCRIPEFIELEGILEYDPLFLDLLEHPRFFPKIRQVLGPDISLIDHGYYITPAGGQLDGQAWHRDVRTPGIYHPRSTVMVRAMITLEDITEEGGATLILPGSHRFTDDVRIPQVERPEDLPGAVALTCRRGSAYFFNGNALHAPSHNRSGVTRRVVLFNYGHKWMRMWKGHEPSEALEARANSAMRRQLLGMTGAYYGEVAEPSPQPSPSEGEGVGSA